MYLTANAFHDVQDDETLTEKITEQSSSYKMGTFYEEGEEAAKIWVKVITLHSMPLHGLYSLKQSQIPWLNIDTEAKIHNKIATTCETTVCLKLKRLFQTNGSL